jgi:hypothetical protein
MQELIDFLNTKHIFRYNSTIKFDTVHILYGHKITKSPLRFVNYWGIGTKTALTEDEKSALRFQKQWLDSLCELLGVEAEIVYIITDTHAMVNNIPRDIIHSYSKSVEAELKNYGYKVEYLSSLYKSYGIDDIISSIKAYDISLYEENSSYQSILRGLKIQSTLRSYENDAEAYIDYFKANMIENSFIEDKYAKYIFITYAPPETKFLLPHLAKLYTYVDKKRRVERPWFKKDKK